MTAVLSRAPAGRAALRCLTPSARYAALPVRYPAGKGMSQDAQPPLRLEVQRVHRLQCTPRQPLPTSGITLPGSMRKVQLPAPRQLLWNRCPSSPPAPTPAWAAARPRPASARTRPASRAVACSRLPATCLPAALRVGRCQPSRPTPLLGHQSDLRRPQLSSTGTTPRRSVRTGHRNRALRGRIGTPGRASVAGRRTPPASTPSHQPKGTAVGALAAVVCLDWRAII